MHGRIIKKLGRRTPIGTIIYVGETNGCGNNCLDENYTKRPSYVTGHFGQPTTPGKPARKRARALMGSLGYVNVRHTVS